MSLIFFWRFQLGLKESWKVSLRVHQEVSLRAKEKPKKKHEDGEILEADMLWCSGTGRHLSALVRHSSCPDSRKEVIEIYQMKTCCIFKALKIIYYLEIFNNIGNSEKKKENKQANKPQSTMRERITSICRLQGVEWHDGSSNFPTSTVQFQKSCALVLNTVLSSSWKLLSEEAILSGIFLFLILS